MVYTSTGLLASYDNGIFMTTITHYFVDEAGDSNIFNARGRAIIGEEGVSRYFIVGMLQVEAPRALSQALETLRHKLLNDPYLADVPSMQLEKRKTALAFHAKDDIPEVRREVFQLLRDFEGLRFYAVVRKKEHVLDYIRSRQAQDSTYRYHTNELYDYLVRQLFKDRLGKADEYHITFAKRGSKDRTQALKNAIDDSIQRSKAKITAHNRISIETNDSNSVGCLQAVDYYLWALQRCAERSEDRYLKYLWQDCSLIVTIQRNNRWGFYSRKDAPLTADVFANL